MDGWEETCRHAAAQCLKRAKTTADQATRAELLILAQRWLALANRSMLGAMANDPQRGEEAAG